MWALRGATRNDYLEEYMREQKRSLPTPNSSRDHNLPNHVPGTMKPCSLLPSKEWDVKSLKRWCAYVIWKMYVLQARHLIVKWDLLLKDQCEIIKHPHSFPWPTHLPSIIKFNQSKLPESHGTVISHLQIRPMAKPSYLCWWWSQCLQICGESH